MNLRSKPLELSLGCFFLASSSLADLPYNPTRAFLARPRNDLVYVLRPSGSDPNQAEFLSIDVSSDVEASSPPLTTVFPSLPFMNGTTGNAYVPTIDASGEVTVYAGDCSQRAAGSTLWRFSPDAQAQHGNGTWGQDTVSINNVSGNNVLDGANYLAGGISFSSTVNGSESDIGFYLFGGMCPHSDATQATWTSDADYSNSMLTLESQSTSTGGDDSYGLGLTSSRGPPIAEAGFTITPLTPTFSNASDGSQSQQQDFVLVGGHTMTAFINMSQVALFSLPQQGWTFLSVNQPSTMQTDSTQQDVSQVEPRSGHTAVLTADGSKIVIFGGWVGDINTPAQPQLAILNAGEGYGGSGSWSWTVPQQSGDGLASGTGIYGHDAILLPGDVMMVVGGSQITPSGSSRAKRQASTLDIMFFNTSSNTWSTDYAPPPAVNPDSNAQGESLGPLTTTSQKAGLGAGLGVGAIAVACLAIFYWWFARRLKRKREEKEREMRQYNGSASDFQTRDLGRDGQDGVWPGATWSGHHRDPSGGDYLWSTRTDDLTYSNGWRNASNQDAERTGLLVEIPSPTRGLRRGRGGQLQSRYDENRVSHGSGVIHPIEERDEDEHAQKGPEMAERHKSHASSLFSNAPTLNPFRDPDPLGSHPIGASTEVNPSTVSASSSRPPLISTTSDDAMITFLGRRSPSPIPPIQDAKDREREVTGWAGSGQAADALLHSSHQQHLTRDGSQRTGGRLSPTKHSDRTDSSLSDQSYRSNLSYSNVSVARTGSQRSAAALLALNPFANSQPSPGQERPSTHQQAKASTEPAVSRPSHSSGRENDSESFTTAHTTLTGPHGSHGSNPNSPTKSSFIFDTHRPRPIPSSHAYTDNPYELNPASIGAGDLDPTTPTKPRLGWVGSVRKAIGAATGITTSSYGRSSSMTSTSSVVPKWARSRGGSFSLDVTASDSAPPPPGGKPSPARGASSSVVSGQMVPRRAASEGGFFWRGKKGARDWAEDGEEAAHPAAAEPFPPYHDEDGAGAENGAARPRRLQRRTREARRRPQTTVGMRGANEAWLREHGIVAGDGAGRQRGLQDEEEDEDWDVEAAAERRLVQVMFTVPKQRLRVVNGDVDQESLRSRSDAGGPTEVEAVDRAKAAESRDGDAQKSVQFLHQEKNEEVRARGGDVSGIQR
ncbi:MAG: hypothetical protein M1822_001442 [Bathelium mastoideum]|nr:MAG: hypothetical protein M1822_001442 [Bathelium mastoideum]